MKFLTWLGLDIFVFLIIASIIGIVLWVRVDATPPVVEQDKPTHFMLEYNVEGTRYVRTLNIENAKLIENVAKDFKINPAHLLAICIQEGSVANPNGNYYACDPEAVGDHGMARGAFQIHTGIHKDVSVADAKHLYYSAVWTAERMIRKGYKQNPKWAMQCHNGCSSRSDRYGNTVWAIAKTMHPITNN